MSPQFLPGAEQSQIDRASRNQADCCDLFRNKSMKEPKKKDACELCRTSSPQQEGEDSAQFVLHFDLVEIPRSAQADGEGVEIGDVQRLTGIAAATPPLREICKSQMSVEQ